MNKIVCCNTRTAQKIPKVVWRSCPPLSKKTHDIYDVTGEGERLSAPSCEDGAQKHETPHSIRLDAFGHSAECCFSFFFFLFFWSIISIRYKCHSQ